MNVITKAAKQPTQLAMNNIIEQQSTASISNLSSFYSVKVGKKSVLVDPINANPYIYITGGKVMEFNPENPRSGTEKLRAGLMAIQEFDRLEPH